MRRAARLLLGFLALFLCAETAFALRVLVVRPTPRDAPLYEAFGRLRAELELEGFQVVVLTDQQGAIDMSALEVAAKERDAFAAVALQRNEGSATAEVYIVDRVTGKTVTRKLHISKAKDGPLLLAIRAAELLRTSLIELRPGQEPPKDVVGAEARLPPAAIVRFVQKPKRFQIAAGAALFFHSELGLSVGASVGGLFRPVPALSLGLNFSGPAFGGEYQAENGAASVRQEFALVHAGWSFGTGRTGLHFEGGPALGVGVAHVDAQGEVAAPLASQRSDLWALGISGGGALELYFSETVSVGLQVSGLGLVPQPVIAVAVEESTPLALQLVSSLRFGVSF